MLKKEGIRSHSNNPSRNGGVFLALGSNKGDRAAFLRNAVQSLIQNHFLVRRVSSVYETDPVGCEDGAGAFLNCVVGGSWNSTPEALLALCRKLEQEAGRDPAHSHWTSRELDIDIILFGSSIVDSASLKIPHPLAHKRAFVMLPLHEIAPNVIFPDKAQSTELLLKNLVPLTGIRLAEEVPPLL